MVVVVILNITAQGLKINAFFIIFFRHYIYLHNKINKKTQNRCLMHIY